jgi:predicted nuclease of predicted toxin-antitoxin system
MKLWIDENIPKDVRKALIQAGHTIRKCPPGTKDPVILQAALEANAVLITRDQDFERRVFLEKRPCAGVIWLRPVPVRRLEGIAVKLLELIEVHEYTLSTSFLTLTLDWIDIRSLNP